MAFAEVLATAGKQDELASTARDVLAIYEAKGDVTGHAVVRARLAALGADVA